ncbi:hypothetical protein ACFT0G_03385 [Streptomyces sp. NPDC057020]|uniref:hypothetical protein n=1 Tax=unclassified Streptomyces TaxID=2593676 RepID=UPI003630C0A2
MSSPGPGATALWTALFEVATAEEALELGHQAQRWKEADVAVAAWRKAASSPNRGVAAKAAGELGRLLMDRAEPQEALPYLLQAAEAGNGSAGSLAVRWYAARGRFEDALPVFRWQADGPLSTRGDRRDLCNVLAALARWDELAAAAERFRAQDSTMAGPGVLWSLGLLRRWDPEGLHRADEDQLIKVFCGWARHPWWKRRVDDLVERLGDTSLPAPTAALVVADEAAREARASHEDPAPAVLSEAELLAETAAGSQWSRSAAWHELIALLWSQGRLGEGEERLREASERDPVAAEKLVRLLRITDRRAEARLWQSTEDPFHRLQALMERGELSAASDVVASHSYLRHALLELYVARGLRAQAGELADEWAREGDPSPALDLYRRSGQWERVLAVLPPNAPREVLSGDPDVVDYGIEALVQLGRLDEAERTARRRFEAGDPFCAPLLADLMIQQGRGDAAEALLDKIRRNGVAYHARQARDQLGRFLSSQGRHAEAVRLLRDQSYLYEESISPRQDPVDRVALARALAGTGAIDEAVGELLSHLKQYPPYATAPAWLTMVELLSGCGRADDVLRIVGAAASTDSGARYALARHYLSTRWYEAALELLLAHPHDDGQFHDSMLCSVKLATLLRDQGRTDKYRLLLWQTAHLNWRESAGELTRGRMWDKLNDVVWAVDASGLVLPGNFHNLRGHIVHGDLSLSPDRNA